ncbi:putative integral membrane protein [Rosellinia necatrix]|uniref:Putative integral membrane protein n=1 Tax=Rosellinia necatrix TaxID=77044 RepID=A0A1W2TKD7_ROSNE|nr:putative integral membrane protein [Rosellinia necatrix]
MEMPASGAPPSLVTTTLLVVAIVFPILGTLAVGLRFYIKHMKKQPLSSDDWVCALAQLASWGISIDIFVAGGLAGIDYTYPSLSHLSAPVIFLRALWIEGFPLVFSLTFVKIAILLYYARIFTTAKFKLAVHIYIVILAAWCIAVIICQLLAANPIQNAWNPLSKTPLRFNYNDFSLAFAGMSLVFDVIVLLFPIPVIRRMQMTWTRKVQVLAIFWLGIFCCVSSAVRFYYLYSEISQVTADGDPHRYLRVSTAFVWGTIEPNTSVIAACLPCYAPLFAKNRGLPTLLANFGSLFSSRGKGKNGGDLLQSDGSYPPQKPDSMSVPWEHYDGVRRSHHVDVERGDSFQAEQDPLKDVHPSLIKVTRDFTATESKNSGY